MREIAADFHNIAKAGAVVATGVFVLVVLLGVALHTLVGECRKLRKAMVDFMKELEGVGDEPI